VRKYSVPYNGNCFTKLRVSV